LQEIVGGTKILLEVGDFRSDRWESKLGRRYSTTEIDNFPNLLTSFLGEWNQVRGKDERITGAGFGVAGPALGNKVKMTHRPITVDGDAIGERFLIPKVRVANDLAAAARAVDTLSSRDLVTIQEGKAVPGEPRVVLGVGTGQALHIGRRQRRYREIAGEGEGVKIPRRPPSRRRSSGSRSSRTRGASQPKMWCPAWA
jgi:glucokinase